MFSEGFPQNKQISYSGLLWLLVAQLIVMAPLMFFLPIWLLPVLLVTAYWRIRVMKEHQSQPSNLIKAVLSVLGIAGLLLSGMTLVSLDMMASLLMLGFAYKSLEVETKRDAIVVILTGFVLIAVTFLYSQDISMGLYGALSLMTLTGAMLAIQQSTSHSILSNLRLASLMLLLCLPLMLMFFVFSPRFAPLWSVPMSGGHSQMGITDSMTPGDIAKLSQSADLAFTVTFADTSQIPKQRDLYWRGLTMQYFDGKTWRQFEDKLSPELAREQLEVEREDILSRLLQKGSAKNYEVIYERTAQPWLFTLAPVVSVKESVVYGSDYRVMANRDLVEPTMFRFTSYPDAVRDMVLSDEMRKATLQLPVNENPKTRILAQQILQSSSSKMDFINNVLNRYRKDEFYYTLHPPILSDKHSIDAFLLGSKKGFCAHYSGSFVFMMRAAGIPARVVTGYQGGEWNKKGQFLSIRQYDAHAWAEVWLKGKGWLRFDPTSMVAPDRIEKNLEAAMSKEGSFLEGQIFSMSKYSWLNSLKSKLDSTQYAWRRFVLGYDSDTQSSFLKGLFGELTMQKTAMIVGGLFSGIIILWIGFLRLGRKAVPEAMEHRLYRKFCEVLKKKGVTRGLSQGPEDFARQASKHLPNFADDITDFTRIYSDICYNPDIASASKEKYEELKRLFKLIKKRN